MNTYETVVRSVCAALTAALLLALSPSVALATVVPSGAPTITMGYPGSAPATLQVGQTVTCNTSSVTFTDSANTAATFQTSVNWYHQDLPTTSIGAMPSYTAVTGDIGFHLVCAVTGTEVGVANATDESALSAPSPVVAPVSTLTLTQYSPQVSGNLGQASSGMNVTLTLSRGTYAYPVPMETPVATGSATTDGAGSWTATLKSTVGPADEAAFGLLGDQLLVHYYSGSGTPPPDVTYSLNGPGFASVQFLGDSSTISPDGGTVALANRGAGLACAGETVKVNGETPQATSSGASNDCVYLPTTRLTDQDHVQAQFAYTYAANMNGSGPISNLSTLSDVGLIGVGAGEANGVPAPTCSVDLVSGHVVCSDLNAGSFTVADHGPPVPLLTQRTTTGQNGYVGTYQGAAFLSGVEAGDEVTLVETGTTRELTKLHVFKLRVDIEPTATTTDCQPGKTVGLPGGYMAPAGTVCPGSGTFTAPTYYGALPGESDDRSGGRTIIQMPSLLNTIPGWNGSVTGGSFTAYGDLGGTGTATQVLTQVASVDLRIVQVANGAIIFDQMMTPGQDTVGPFETATVNGLSPGRYLATFTLTDSHGDTSASQNPFVVEPSGIVAAQGTEGSQGPTAATGAITSAGPQGQAGPQGPQPQAGKSSSCTLTNRTVGTGRSKHKVQQIKCVLISSARGLIRVTISRGTATYATATAVVRPGMAQIRLRSLRPMKAGRYLVTIFTPGRKHATVTHFTMRI